MPLRFRPRSGLMRQGQSGLSPNRDAMVKPMLIKLNRIAIQQMRVLEDEGNRKLLK